jgi:hypothetical protein
MQYTNRYITHTVYNYNITHTKLAKSVNVLMNCIMMNYNMTEASKFHLAERQQGWYLLANVFKLYQPITVDRYPDANRNYDPAIEISIRLHTSKSQCLSNAHDLYSPRYTSNECGCLLASR